MEQRGFSFIEMLVALLLTISISLALLKQQWQMSRLRIKIQQQDLIWLQESNRRELGLSILECMLGLALALSILTLLMQQYLQIKQQTYHATQTMLQISRMHTVVNLLRESGHQAGYTPCLPLGALRSFDHRTGEPLLMFNWNPQTMAVTFNRMSSQFVSLSPSTRRNIFLVSGHFIPHLHQPLMLSDCQHAEVVEGYDIGSHKIQFSQPLKYRYHFPIFLGEWLSETFWVKANARGQQALFYQKHHHAEELLTGMQSMQGYVETKNQRSWMHLSMSLTDGKIFPLIIRMYHANP